MLYEINEKALKLESEGKKIIRLNLGDPDMATPPEIVEAAYASMKAGKTKYSSSYGELNFGRKSQKSMALNPKTSLLPQAPNGQSSPPCFLRWRAAETS